VRLSPRLSRLLHRVFTPLKVPLLEVRAARQLAVGPPRLRVPLRDRPVTVAERPIVRIARRGGRIAGIEADRSWIVSRDGFSTAVRRLGVFLDLLSDPRLPDGSWRAELGDSASQPGRMVAFCSHHAETTLVPDRGFFSSGGYAAERRRAAAAPPFADRDAAIVWRGSPSGQGAESTPDMRADDPALRQRVRMCLALRHLPRDGAGAVDVRLVTGRNMAAASQARFAASGIAGDRLPQASWCGRRFAIDVDGNANAFSNLFVRLLYGCCVIKIASPGGFRQWYYDRLRPWEHYVPVAADCSDLETAIDWCRGHPREAGTIAAAGRALALEMTVASERERAVAAILAAGV